MTGLVVYPCASIFIGENTIHTYRQYTRVELVVQISQHDAFLLRLFFDEVW